MKTAKEELINFVLENEFILKPTLRNKFILLLDKTIIEAQNESKKLNTNAVIGINKQLCCSYCGALEPCAGNSPETCYHYQVCEL
jgi:hypothetical protein